MTAVIAKVPNRRELVASHRSRPFASELIGRWLSIVFEVAQGGSVAVLSMGLEPQGKLPREVGDLNECGCTPGLEVVEWQKVEPVGGMLGGYLER